MNLNEWKDSNGNKINPSSSAASNKTSSGSSTTGFKGRFLRLLTYHMTHRKSTVVNYKIKALTDDSFLYIEEHKNPATGEEYEVDYSVFIEPATEDWRLIVRAIRNTGSYPDDIKGNGWVRLLRELQPYMSIPTRGTPEYNGLLTESAPTSIADDFKAYENLWD